MSNQKSYVIIPNVAFAFGTKYHLDKDEFMVFAHLQMMKQIGLENKNITMIEILINGLGWETTTKHRDKKRVVSALEGLQDKGYISIEHNGKVLKDILVITINKGMESLKAETKVDWKEQPFTWKGYTQVSYDKYNLAENNGYRLMAISYTTWRNNNALQYEWKICIKEWEGVFGVTDKTAREILAKCEGFITKISGDYYKDEAGQVKQEANQYTLIKEVNSAVKAKDISEEAKSESILDSLYNKVIDMKVISNDSIFKQIFDKKTFIKFEGYKVWKETECPIVKEGGQKKINSLRLSNNSIANEVAERLEREYQEYLSKQTQQKEWIKQSIDNHIDMLGSDGVEFESSYVPKEKSNEYFFED